MTANRSRVGNEYKIPENPNNKSMRILSDEMPLSSGSLLEFIIEISSKPC
jgi:hypothetical protein